jgi:hypothetical protein
MGFALVRRSASVFVCLLAALAASAVVARPVEASTILYRTDAELVALSERVIHARVLRQRTARPAGREGAIYTVTTLAVLEDLTGVAGDLVEVWELGGDFGDEQMVIGGAVSYDVGADVLVCLDRGRFGLRSVAMGFSKFDVEPLPTADGTLDGRLRRNMSDTVVVGAGQGLRTEERTLGQFRELAQQIRGMESRRNPSADLLVPEPNRRASFTLLTFSNGLGPRWTEADSNTAVNWYKNTSAPTPLTSGDGVSEIQTALVAWTNPTSASIILNYAGTTSQSSASGPWSGIASNSGVITFEDPNGEISGSTLAIGGGFASFGNGGTVNGATFNKFVRGYVIFQNAADLSSSFKQTLNFTRVMEHEIGHTIGLGHTQQDGSVANPTSNIMYPSCCSTSTPVAPALGPDDLDGLNFIYPASGTIIPTCSFSISPTSASVGSTATTGSVSVTATAGCGWLGISNSPSFISVTGTPSGTGNGTLNYSVAANSTGATRTGTISIAGQTFTITQSATPSCSYTLSPTSATTTTAGGAATVGVTAPTGCAWTAVSNAAFVSITSGTAGSGNGTVSYTVAANTVLDLRSGTLTVAGQTFTVTQSGTGPTMSVDRTSLYFGATTTSVAFTTKTRSQTIRLSQSGVGPVTWTVTPSHPWITVSPSSGSGPATLTVSMTYSNTVPMSGSSSGTIAFAFTGAGTGVAPINVNLATFPVGSSAGAIGSFDTPANNVAGVTGSIAVTGWSIDDVEVSQVRIWRDPVAGEGTGLVFIGTAVFVEGSRPDVASLYPTKPLGSRAGWGYLMLTNFLPGLGNGTFRIHAYADDVEGHSTLLGTRTITCTNSSAILPFGAIDTPEQGEVVSGTSYSNFGWVLARAAYADPTHGGTVQVLIDGVLRTSPGGWVSRPDLTALFPAATYPGVANALGVFGFDTTTLTNGLHTIAWVVTSNTNQSDGIGSRYFTVSNGSAGSVGSGVQGSLMVAEEINAATLDRSAITGRRGFDLGAPFRTYTVAADGRTTVRGEEMDRFELGLSGGGSADRYTGFMRVGNDLGPLPIGSHLDGSTGVFTWQPGVGFVGSYDLVFVRCGSSPPCFRQEIRVVLHSKQSGWTGPQVVIDLPASAEATVGKPVSAEATVGKPAVPGSKDPGLHPGLREGGIEQPFVVAGWAIDSDDEVGTGVDTLHVWAYPVTNPGAPQFVGVAAYGGERPDVGTIFGERFTPSGYGSIVDGLAPGTYDLAVFAWSTAQRGFVPAKVVRVTVR